MLAAGTLTRIEHRDQRCVIILAGEIDIAVAGGLTDLGCATIATTDARGIVVDLTRVGFMDRAGLSVLVAFRNAALARGLPLRLLGPSRTVRKVLTITGLDALFTFSQNNDVNHGS
jgi:anti-sigma B factor antagonist